MKLETDQVLGIPTPLTGEGGWRLTGALILAALGAIVVLYWDTAVSMVVIWGASNTYSHGYFIVPIALWLAWGKRAQLAKLSPRPHYAGFALLAAAGFAWLVAEAGRTLVVQQYALMAMPAAVVLALAGRHVAAALAFPLAFLLFAVPTGEALVPLLMDWTADSTVAALRLSGIPVYREGNNFNIPTGSWSVIEACSGLRYVIASVTVGTLFAYLNYRRLWKQVLFVAASVVVPVIANFMRAYLLVMTGHLSNMTIGVGPDHVFFGWAFFGVAIGALFWLASFWRDVDGSTAATTVIQQRSKQPAPGLIAVAAAGTVVLAAAWPMYAAHLDRWGQEDSAAPLARAEGTAGWVPDGAELTTWRPSYVGASSSSFTVYRKGEHAVAVYIAYYRNQRQGAELISWQNAVLLSDDRRWARVGERVRDVHLDAGVFRVHETRIRSAPQRLVVWDWYRVGGSDSASPYVAKALLARDKLLGRGDASAAILLAAPYDASPEAAAETLRVFMRDMLPAINRALDIAGDPG